MAEKQLTNEEVEAFRKELADIKADMMRKELEEIKKERMRKELDELKRERSAGSVSPSPKTVYVQAPAKPALSLLNLIMSAIMLLIAGYLIGTIYRVDVGDSIDSLLTSYSLPAIGSTIVIVLALILIIMGMGLMLIIRKQE